MHARGNMSKHGEDCQFVVGVDVGGTNSDTAILHGAEVVGFAKRPTTLDKTEGVINSIQAALSSLPEQIRTQLISSQDVRVAIGTTHFTNAVIERDAKNLDRVSVIRLCGSSTHSLPPFVDFPEDLRQLLYGGGHLVGGGLEYSTQEISQLDEAEIRRCVNESLSQTPPVKNFVICGVFSPCDDPHDNQETKAAAIVRSECARRGVECNCTLSHELAMLGLLERENASILNESLKRLAAVTITAFSEALSTLDLCVSSSATPSFYLTQNDGTLISAEEAIQYPVLTFSSGPTNSMRGAAFLTKLLNAIVVDIGGTTSDVGVLVNGFPRQASTQCKVGGVRTNFPMPDVNSIGLGGGSHVTFDPDSGLVEVGPKSVGYEISTKALCFGGPQCTATDVAVAAGVARSDFCTSPQAVSSLTSDLVTAAMAEMKVKLENVIDSMKTENEPWPVILVGGGSILIDKTVQLKGVSTIECPKKYFGVANAVGAALGTVGGSSDRIVNLATVREHIVATNPDLKSDGAESLDKMAREAALEKGRELAREEVGRKGGLADTVYIHSEDLTDITYVMDRVRVRVKAIGSLTRDNVTTAAHPYVHTPATPTQIKTDTIGQEGTEYSPTPPSKVVDNPSWPYTSEEERKKDVEAGLDSPNVDKDTGVWVLSVDDVIALATGAGILGCGGGGSPYDGQLRAIQLIKSGKTIKIVNPCRVKEEDRGLVCGVAFMGAPAIFIEKLPGGLESSLALDTLERVLASGVCEGVEEGRVGSGGVEVVEREFPRFDGTHFPGWVADNESLMSVDMSNVSKERRVTGLICLEAGGCNSIEPLLVGATRDLPVLDVDGMGRAFPELQMFVPFINGSRHSPSSLADNQGERIACTHVGTSKDLENFFRVETVRMGLGAAIATGVMSYNEMLDKSVLFTMSQAWQLGRAVIRAKAMHSNVVKAVVEMQHGITLLIGKVVSVQRATTAGFNTIEAVIEGLNEFSGCQLRVLAKNENYIAQRVSNGQPKEVLACTPDLISIIDSDNGEAITTELIRYGLRVGVVVLPANQMLKTEKALKVVGPKAFGFDMSYQEPRPFPRGGLTD